MKEKLASSGAVLIEGAKWCGKTSTGNRAAKSIIYMQDPDRAKGYLKLADTQPSILLEGENPRLIDEWQMAPVLWDAVRFDVDKRGGFGHFILTGSAVPKDGTTMHTGTERISRLLMRPMSLWESKESTGQVSLKDLFEGKHNVHGENKLTIKDIGKILCRGGWPEAVTNENASCMVARNYVDSVVNLDVQRVDGVERNPTRVRALLRSYARNISTMTTYTTILNDVNTNDTTFSDTTMNSYMNALRRIFVIEDTPAWKPSLRSKTGIRSSTKQQFVDPSIATAVMHLDEQSILNDFEYFGFLFESLVTRDLRIYSQTLDGEIYYYHDRLDDGRWAAMEVKLGNEEIEDGAKHLCDLRDRVDTSKVGEPSFLMVITGGQFAYRRNDGVLIVPIGCLRP
ncbi:MAG: DUF4143 domain-containing protein [Bacteroidales bacterium]|nr:DUF4143 domain-containing protein [Bacteroidales bacterium]